MKTTDILKIAYNMELRGRDFYENQKDKVQEPRLKKAFNYLTDMEKDHANYIKNQIDNLSNNKPIESLPQTEDKFSKVFEKEGVISSDKLDTDYGDYSIIRMAYLLEKDFVEYYDNAAKNNEGELKEMFLSLKKWEEEHAQLMKNYLQNLIKRNSIEEKFFEPLY